MRFPDVLIIGAMKAGTTSLYMDLAEHPQVFLSGDKEPQSLCGDHVLTTQGRKEYAAIYARARPNQLLIDASTNYSKRPDFEGIIDRALKTLPENFKVIYIVRHPIERIVSQYVHEFSAGDVGPDIDEIVRTHPRFLNYSRYAYQLVPWIEGIGWDRISVVRFEDYSQERAAVLRRLQDFLGLAEVFRAGNQGKVYNRSQGKPVRNRFWTQIRDSSWYRQGIRPLLSAKMRLRLLKLLLPKAPACPMALSPSTAEWLRDELADDMTRLNEILGATAPLWDDFSSPKGLGSTTHA